MAEMEKKTVNAMGDVCPVPLVKAKNAIAELAGSGKVEVLVDNEIAVQNLEKMAQQKGYGARPLKRYLQNYVETLTAKKILSGDVHAGDTIVLDVKDGAFTVSTK